MSIEWVNSAIDDLRAWGRARGAEVDADEIRLLCDYASDYLNVGELADFTPATFEELLLSIYPRKVIAPPETAQESIDAALTLVDYLESGGLVAAPVLADMRATLAAIAPQLPAALADQANFGMTKSLFSAIGPEALEQSITIPSGEVPDLGTPPCECPGCSPLPAVRLAPTAALAAAVRRAPILHDLHTLVAWLVESGATPTVKRRLRAKDAARSPVPEPVLLWDLALYTGVVEADGAAMTVDDGFGPLADRDDEDLLDLWSGTVEFLVERDTHGAVTGSAELDGELYDLFDMLYRLQVPVPVAVIGEYLAEIVEEGEVDVAGVLDRLAHCGMVTLDGEQAGLTPPALWGLRELYAELGMDAPIAGDLADADAMGLIEGLLEGIPTELAEEDIERWLARRNPAKAAGDLLSAASGAPAVARGIAVTIVDRLDAAAEPAVRACLDDSELRPHAIHWLAARGLAAPPLTQEELLWVSVDMLALALPSAEEDPEVFAENMAASGPPAHMIEEMWRVDHPDVVDVLELLGRSLPDGTVAKAARKAAFKARSRAIG
ncbi:hypothetical protein ACIBG8_17065 [Nonomuraea sp. NPDC050556]|uniref:hypothetical protein n=1 Tax=Nonomuraea sp. NPDC050556 TaxID=3364369 RepID=UPI0037B2F246